MNFSVVIPCFRSTESILQVVESIDSLYPNQCDAIILVQDGPDRSTSERLSQCASISPIVKVIELTDNVGQHQATLCGIQHASPDSAVITIDDDMQIHPKEMAKLMDKFLLTGADLVYGIYLKRHHNILRKSLATIFGRIISMFSSIPSKGSSFKIISPELVHFLHQYSSSFVFLDAVLAKKSKLISFSEVNHLPRTSGVSGYNWYKLTRIGFQIIMHYTSIPIFVFFPVGVLLFSFPLILMLCSDSLSEEFSRNFDLGFFGMMGFIFAGLVMMVLGVIGQKKRMGNFSGAKGHGFKIKM
ncbi:MAG: glycosyltransferase [Bacteroidota bacterium]|nr:glycosyltransferase [Bacteroidota bacterium]MEC8031901.1 glycosyltransferase [Bacteroidota bacterium]MEC8756516.1 glycosyltransferase [Bacteroidota bacterium]MEC8834870.1 glycosyltransferase [Bacteroidota bacterium]MEC9221986.1 glycosyltransferase [Bacteroidota bacterium]